MIKAIFFDIDDTLIKYGKDKVEESALTAINEAKKNEIKIIVATGRGYSFMHQDVKDRVKADYYITVNGSCINDVNGNTVESYPFDLETTNRLIDLLSERDYPFGFKFAQSFQIYNRYEDFIAQYCNKAIPASKLIDNTGKRDYHLQNGLPLDCFIYSPNKEMLNFADSFPQLQFLGVYGDGSECWLKTVNKGKSIKRLTEIIGISLEECMAFGDALNDLEMLCECKIGVAMGNGKEEVKQRADYVTDDIEHDGIYNAMKHFNII
ncbi:MAG: Cof-type HAD-IIB family hydrolase [Erysipelotrichia bacterium]|nr:Cof-type HAD-IIB family hydrolase [Erysipelotrichia bacterium]